MEDKLFDLLEKLYIEMQHGFANIRKEMQDEFSNVRKEMQGEFSNVRKEMQDEFSNVHKEIDGTNQRLVSLENKLASNLKALYDGYNQNTQSINRLEKKIDELTEKVDRHDIEIKVIKNAQ